MNKTTENQIAAEFVVIDAGTPTAKKMRELSEKIEPQVGKLSNPFHHDEFHKSAGGELPAGLA